MRAERRADAMTRTPRGGRRGRYHGHPTGVLVVTRLGYGFVQTAEGEFFIPRGNMRGAFDGDTVEVRPEPHRSDTRGRSDSRMITRSTESRRSDAPVGSIVRVLRRAHDTLIGRFEQAGTLGVVVPDDTRIPYDVFIAPGSEGQAREGDMVVVRLVAFPNRHEPAQGVVEEVLGVEGKHSVDTEALVRRHGLETSFSAAALEQARDTTLDLASALAEPDRLDLRDRFIFTIDPADAKDFDDALSLEYHDGVACLGVHIADVSRYVPWGSPLDVDARRRATSVYLPDRVLSMLPERLSDDLCSLRPGQDRLAFTVDVRLRPDGTVEASSFHPSLIRSRLRLDYGTVQRILDGGVAAADCDLSQAGITASSLEQLLRDLDRFARRRRMRRAARGSLDFDLPELKVELDGEGRPECVHLRERSAATSLVEEAMLLANEAVAEFMFAHGAPMIYRIHEEPDAGRLAELAPTLEELGFKLTGTLDEPRTLQELLVEAARRPDKVVTIPLLLRAMKRARYLERWTGHFGLASPVYTHFTSPIRRYPDLLVHRLLRLQLAIEQGESLPGEAGAWAEMIEQLPWLAQHASAMEREAEKTTLEAVNLKVCEYMESFVGEVFDAYVSGLGMQGIFVKLENTVEGFVPAESLSEPLVFDEVHSVLSGVQSTRVYRLGQRVRVELTGTDYARGRINFTLCEG